MPGCDVSSNAASVRSSDRPNGSAHARRGTSCNAYSAISTEKSRVIVSPLDSVAETLKLSAIVSYTSSGTTGLRAARERPLLPIIALSPILATARRLSLAWGLHCVISDDPSDLDDMVDRACRIAYQEGFAKPGERVIITAGVPLGTPGSTNMIRIAYIGSDGHSGI